MSVELWLMFCAAYLLTTLTPGPNVLLVVKNSAQHGLKAAMFTVLGNLACQLLVVGLVAVGVGELLSRLPTWFLVMKLIGGGYLIYLGIKSLRASGLGTQVEFWESRTQMMPKARCQLVRQAFWVSASNPKTLVFLSAFLPQFLDTQHPHWQQFAVMYASICVIVASVHFAYAWAVSQLGKRTLLPSLQAKIAKVTGGLFITMGGGVLLSSRS